MAENKFTKYLLYAIGEIVLVVIGILIALSINNWNTQRLNIKKERSLLLEIKENLNEDLQIINSVLNFNNTKINAIDSAFYYMSLMDENPLRGKLFSYQMPIITTFELFSPVRVAFDNFVSSGNIDILSSDHLRKKISRYYSNDNLDGIQSQLAELTQSFVHDVGPKMINKNLMKSITQLDYDVIPVEKISVHKDPDVLAGLFIMKNKTSDHQEILDQIKIEITSIGESIDEYLNVSN